MEERKPCTDIDSLSAECHQLVDAIASHRLNIKLLKTARDLLRMVANYKGSRLKLNSKEV